MTGALSSYIADLNRLMETIDVQDGHGTHLSLDAGGSAVSRMLTTAKAQGQKVMVVGNGGSAAIASHIQNDICKALGTRSLVFTEQPLLTALANDDGYETAYESMVNLWAQAGDLLIAISSSGRSPNILRAVKAAKAATCQVVTLSGFGADNPLRFLGDVNFYVASSSYGLVETTHAALGQYFTDAVKNTAAPQKKEKI